MNTDKTKVIFRKYRKSGEIIAMFPELPGNNQYWLTCLSYLHVGQHGAASVELVFHTLPATPDEYSDLKAELESIGYDLHIAYCFTRADYNKRQEACKP